jgi:hypothetical protein
MGKTKKFRIKIDYQTSINPDTKQRISESTRHLIGTYLEIGNEDAYAELAYLSESSEMSDFDYAARTNAFLALFQANMGQADMAEQNLADSERYAKNYSEEHFNEKVCYYGMVYLINRILNKRKKANKIFQDQFLPNLKKARGKGYLLAAKNFQFKIFYDNCVDEFCNFLIDCLNKSDDVDRKLANETLNILLGKFNRTQ